ncbi:hypothetical protein [Pseudohaliea sp.]|uniref:esterase/lipase family protein n=1 Tax=Pseudohaliea sp. TaxID=2740289 RepID=UPI0032EEB47C
MPVTRDLLRGTARLAFDTVGGVTTTVEQMHETIARLPAPWAAAPAAPTRAHGLVAAGVYSTVRGVNGLVGAAVDRSLALWPDAVGEARESGVEVSIAAALNGARGDHLEATGNPLAIPMQLRTATTPLALESGRLQCALPAVSPHLVVLVHGLGLSERDWWRRGRASIGDRLEAGLGWTPLYLRYNTGRHISTNGQELATLLEQLCAAWPVPVASLTLVGHSMGGLVIRSACWYAEARGLGWLGQLARVACLGSPHHGSMLAKAGHTVDALLRRVPYVAPFAFGERLSAGVADLRHGDLLDEDWAESPTGLLSEDRRRPVPLTPGVAWYFLAASVGRHERDPLGDALGDLLVRLGSASGHHDDDLRRLAVEPDNCRVFHERNHFDLLDDERVHRQLLDWFGDA